MLKSPSRMLQLVLNMLRCLAFDPMSCWTWFFVVRAEAPPGSKENGRGGNDGSDIAIMRYMSFKTPLPFLRPCPRTDTLFSAVFSLFSIIRILLLRAGSVAQVAFQLILIVLPPLFRFDYRPFPSVFTLFRYVRNVFTSHA